MSQQGTEDHQYIIICLANGDRTETGRCLQRAYQLWQSLTPSQMHNAHDHVKRHLPPGTMGDLYDSLVFAFETWDQIQMETGAIGWSMKESQILEICKYFGDSIFRLLPALQKVWCDIKVFQNDMQEEDDHPEEERKSSPSKQSLIGSRRKSPPEGGMVARKSKCDLRNEHRRTSIKFEENEDFERQNASSVEDDDSSFRLQEPRYEPLEETKASQIITVDQDDSMEDLSLGAEARHLRNLQIDNSQDADFEKQISPLMSDEESLKDEGTEKL